MVVLGLTNTGIPAVARQGRRDQEDWLDQSASLIDKDRQAWYMSRTSRSMGPGPTLEYPINWPYNPRSCAIDHQENVYIAASNTIFKISGETNTELWRVPVVDSDEVYGNSANHRGISSIDCDRDGNVYGAVYQIDASARYPTYPIYGGWYWGVKDQCRLFKVDTEGNLVWIQDEGTFTSVSDEGLLGTDAVSFIPSSVCAGVGDRVFVLMGNHGVSGNTGPDGHGFNVCSFDSSDGGFIGGDNFSRSDRFSQVDSPFGTLSSSPSGGCGFGVTGIGTGFVDSNGNIVSQTQGPVGTFNKRQMNIRTVCVTASGDLIAGYGGSGWYFGDDDQDDHNLVQYSPAMNIKWSTSPYATYLGHHPPRSGDAANPVSAIDYRADGDRILTYGGDSLTGRYPSVWPRYIEFGALKDGSRSHIYYGDHSNAITQRNHRYRYIDKGAYGAYDFSNAMKISSKLTRLGVGPS